MLDIGPLAYRQQLFDEILQGLSHKVPIYGIFDQQGGSSNIQSSKTWYMSKNGGNLVGKLAFRSGYH